MKKIAEGHSATLRNNFIFNPKNYVNKSLVFNLKKTSEKKILDKIIQNLPWDNDKYWIERREGLNMFMIKQDKKQQEEDNLIKTTWNIYWPNKNGRNVTELIGLWKWEKNRINQKRTCWKRLLRGQRYNKN